MKVVKVIPLTKGLKKESLSYFTARDIDLGSIVSVPVRKKIIDALVVDLEDVSRNKSEVKSSLFRLKKIEKVKGKINLSDAFLRSADKIKDYYASTAAETLSTLIPKVFLECHEKLLPYENQDGTERSNLKQEKLILQSATEERISFYKTFVRESFAKKKSVLICLPTYKDIEYFAPLITKGIEDYVYIFHNEIGKKDFMKRYNKLAKEDHPVLILVSPYYLFLARQDLSAMIIEKESSNSYKMMSRPSIDLRLLAEVLSKDLNLKIIFADTLVRAETLKRRQDQELGEVLPISFRAGIRNQKELISLEKVEGEEKKFKILSPELEEKLNEALRLGERSFLFVLRKGLAPITICNDCKKPFLCDSCEAPMVLYQSESKQRIYICHRCRNKKDAKAVCGTCQSWNLAALGIGTDLVRKEAEKKWPDRTILLLDKDTAKTPSQAQKIIAEFYKTKGAILIGTEMAINYLDQPIENTAVVSFDSLFSIPDFRMGEKIVHLLVNLSGLAEKSFMIQTRNPKDLTLSYFLSGNLAQFFRDEFENREKFNYPPFSVLIKITLRGTKEAVIKSQALIETLLKDYDPMVYRAFIPRVKNLYILNALIKIKKENWSLPEISSNGSLDQTLLYKLKSLSQSFNVQIDPDDLL